MVRSHIGNVVCRKALCVRVASSPPRALNSQNSALFSIFSLNRRYACGMIRKRYLELDERNGGSIPSKTGCGSMKRDEVAAFYKDLSSYEGKTVTVCGWARSIRDSKTLGFIDLNDGSSFKGVQVVFEDGKIENFKGIASQNVGAALKVTGMLLATPEAKQPFEIHASKIEIEGASTPEYPLQKKRHSVEYLRTIAHLRPRTNLYSAAFRVRSAAAFGVHKFFQENGFVYAHTLRLCDPSVLPGERLRLCQHPADHRKRLRGSRRDVPGDHSGPGKSFPYRRRQGGIQRGFFPKADISDGFRTVGSGMYGHGLFKGVHFRAHVPCGTLLYAAPRS